MSVDDWWADDRGGQSSGTSIPDQIAADMRALTPATRKAIRPKLRAAGRMVVDDAKSRSSWSSRIPGTVRMTTSFRVDREGVTVSAGTRSTPHARPYEDVLRRGRFRHPVFADAKNRTRKGWIWVTQQSRSFLFPAAEARQAEATAAIRSALDEAASELGFEG